MKINRDYLPVSLDLYLPLLLATYLLYYILRGTWLQFVPLVFFLAVGILFTILEIIDGKFFSPAMKMLLFSAGVIPALLCLLF